jgi:hypothetical protein
MIRTTEDSGGRGCRVIRGESRDHCFSGSFQGVAGPAPARQGALSDGRNPAVVPAREARGSENRLEIALFGCMKLEFLRRPPALLKFRAGCAKGLPVFDSGITTVVLCPQDWPGEWCAAAIESFPWASMRRESRPSAEVLV